VLTHLNEVEIKVLSGSTGEVLHHWKDENAISDDFTVGGGGGGRIYVHDITGPATPYLFLLPDGPNWTSGAWAAQGSVFDRQNPWAPYCSSINNFVDTGAEPFRKAATTTTFVAPDNTTLLPFPTGIAGRWKMFFQWGTPGLPFDFQLKALGLTAWENDINDQYYGAGNVVNMQQTIFVPQTLVVLPTAITIHGRAPVPLGVPDVLQVSYYLSVVGAS
jgi:hypothetical protein